MEEDIWNFDETGFNIGMSRDQWIDTREIVKKKHSVGKFKSRICHCFEAVSASGMVIGPYIIFSAKTLLRGWLDSNSEKGSITEASETGYMDDIIA